MAGRKLRTHKRVGNGKRIAFLRVLPNHILAVACVSHKWNVIQNHPTVNKDGRVILRIRFGECLHQVPEPAEVHTDKDGKAACARD